jgi:hypothetical protein
VSVLVYQLHLSEEQITDNLGISTRTIQSYKNNHRDFLLALKNGKQSFVAEIVKALVRRAKGFESSEVKTYIKKENGREIKYQEHTQKYYPPDVAACSFLLKNKDRGNWSDNPMKIALEREYLALRLKIEEMKMF